MNRTTNVSQKPEYVLKRVNGSTISITLIIDLLLTSNRFD